MEHWLKYKDTQYEISDHGNVRNWKTGRTLRPTTLANGYKSFIVRHNGQSIRVLVHRLVAELFVEGYSEEANIVNHKDGKKDNNSYLNLEWCSYADNLKHAYYEIQTNKKVRPVLQLRMDSEEIVDTFPSLQAAQRATEIPATNISKACRGINGYSQAGGFKWRYKEDE